MRGALEKLLRIAYPGEGGGDQLLISLGNLRPPRELLNVIPVSLGRGNPPSRCMRLLQQTGVSQIGHNVANRSRTQAVFVSARKRPRSHGLTRGNVGFDYRG